jgi:chondroitin 4-sulfotransferase 11
MIIEKYNAVFFHVPKVAGYSIEQYLLPQNRNWKIFDENILFGLHNGIMTQHLNYSEMLYYKSREFLDSHFKFAFFRNTWDRFCSAFFYLEPHYLKQQHTFDNFVESTCLQVASYKKTNGWHFAKQTDWLFKDDGTLALNFIGRYENLNNDFKLVCEKLNIEYKPLKRLNTSKNSSINYRDMYTDRTKNLIAEAYAEEIKYFDYKF